MYMDSIILRRSMHITETDTIQMYTCTDSGGDPGFPVGGGANPPGDGRQHINLPDFLQNCMKLRKCWSVGGRPHWISHCNYNRESRIVCVWGGGGSCQEGLH